MKDIRLKIARDLNKIAKELTDNTPDTHDFQVMKNSIVNFCEQEYLRCQRFYANCQNYFSASTQGLECYTELLQIILRLKKIANKAEKAKPKKK